jgi:hypothetical protein
MVQIVAFPIGANAALSVVTCEKVKWPTTSPQHGAPFQNIDDMRTNVAFSSIPSSVFLLRVHRPDIP